MGIQRRDFLCSLAASQLPWLTGGRCLIEVADDLRDRLLGSGGEIDWNEVRKEIALSPEINYLNSGSAGPSPRTLLAALSACQSRIEQNPIEHLWGKGLIEDLQLVREQVAESQGVASDEILFMENTTTGLSAIANGIRWATGDEIVITNHEHLSCSAVWKYVEREFGVEIKYLEMPAPDHDDELFLASLESRLTAQTRLVCLSHVDTLTGLQLPIRRASELVRSRGILFVCDAAQSLGMIDFRTGELQVDALAASGHKWLLGPKGLGLLYISHQAQAKIKPLVADWGYQLMTATTGTRNLGQLFAWATLLHWQQLIPPAVAAERMQTLQRYATQRLAAEPALRLVIELRGDWTTGMRSYKMPASVASENLRLQLRGQNIEVKAIPPTYEIESGTHHPKTDYNAIRISTHIFNNESDIDRAVDAMRAVISNG